jgi:hypothetical protein
LLEETPIVHSIYSCILNYVPYDTKQLFFSLTIRLFTSYPTETETAFVEAEKSSELPKGVRKTTTHGQPTTRVLASLLLLRERFRVSTIGLSRRSYLITGTKAI